MTVRSRYSDLLIYRASRYMWRFGSKTVQFSKNIVHESTRELLQSDNFYANPDLLAQAMAELEAQRAPDG